MKKSLIALAAFAVVGAASAQSTVTLSGTVKSGLAFNSYSGSAVATQNGSNTSLSDGSSRFALSGTEDLGGGLKAMFRIEQRIRIDDSGGAPTSGPIAGGNTFVGLQGGFGMVQLGKLDTHYCMGSDSHGSRATSLAASSCAILGLIGGSATAVAGNSRMPNTIRYTSPNMSGFTGELGYSTGLTDGAVNNTSGGNTMNAALNYANGPITAGLSFFNQKSEDRTVGLTAATAALNGAGVVVITPAAAITRNDQNAYTLMANYNFGVATAGLTYDNSSNNVGANGGADATTKRTAWSIPVTVPVGAGTVLFTYTRTGNRTLNGAAVADSGANMFSLGYDYALSKRTSVGASYVSIKNGTAASYGLYALTALNGTPANAAGQKANQFYVGVRHAF